MDGTHHFPSKIVRQLSRGRRTSTIQVGIQLDGDRLAAARVAVVPGQPPRLQGLQAFTADNGRRDGAIAELIRSGWLRQARVHLVLAPGQYETLQIPAPPVPPDELREAIRWQLRGALSFPPDDAALDVVTLPAGDNGPQRATLLVFATPRTVVEQAVAPWVAQGVEIDAVDVPDMALRNLDELDAPADAPCAALSFEADACLMIVYYQGHLCFTRRIPLRIGTSDAPEAPEEPTELAVRIAMQVQRSLDLFERQSGLPNVGRLRVGPYSHGALVARAIAANSDLATGALNLKESLIWDGDAAGLDAGRVTDELPLCLSALGASLRNAAPAGYAGRTGGRVPGWSGWLTRLRRAA